MSRQPFLQIKKDSSPLLHYTYLRTYCHKPISCRYMGGQLLGCTSLR